MIVNPPKPLNGHELLVTSTVEHLDLLRAGQVNLILEHLGARSMTSPDQIVVERGQSQLSMHMGRCDAGPHAAPTHKQSRIHEPCSARAVGRDMFSRAIEISSSRS